nr:hypothetical protein [Paenibacillus wynnii]
MDFSLTSDDKLVARHDWEESYTQYLQQVPQNPSGSWQNDYFMDQKIFEKYTPLGINQVIKLMQEHEDMYIVTDTKNLETDIVKHQFQLIVNAAKNNPSLLNRVIPQIYNQKMLDDTEDTEQQVIEFMKEKRIKVVTMPEYKVNHAFISALKENGILAFVHTINELEVVRKYELMGVHGFYTDILTDEDLQGL